MTYRRLTEADFAVNETEKNGEESTFSRTFVRKNSDLALSTISLNELQQRQLLTSKISRTTCYHRAGSLVPTAVHELCRGV